MNQRERFLIMRRDGFKCTYCGRKPEEAELEIDHIVPLAGGGTDEESNLTTACGTCNRGKGIIDLNTGTDHQTVKKEDIEEESGRFHYTPRAVRISDEAWEKLKEHKLTSRKSWNRFILELINVYDNHIQGN